MKNRDRLILNIVTFFLTSLLLVFVCLAWYASNKVAKVESGTGVTSNHSSIQFLGVTGKRFSLSGNYEKKEYEISGTDLVLTRVDSYDVVAFKTKTEYDTYIASKTVYTRNNPTGEVFTEDTSGVFSSTTVYYEYTLKNTFTDSDNRSFQFAGMLPGEYVDISIRYTMDDDMDGNDYKFILKDISGGNFTVDDHTHYSYGAYSYKNLSLTPKTGTVSFSPDADYTFLTEYEIDKDDLKSADVELFSSTWDKDNEELTFTFRIMEDFTQFYGLLGKASKTYGNLLNALTFKIGSLFILA